MALKPQNIWKMFCKRLYWKFNTFSGILLYSTIYEHKLEVKVLFIQQNFFFSILIQNTLKLLYLKLNFKVCQRLSVHSIQIGDFECSVTSSMCSPALTRFAMNFFLHASCLWVFWAPPFGWGLSSELSSYTST